MAGKPAKSWDSTTGMAEGESKVGVWSSLWLETKSYLANKYYNIGKNSSYAERLGASQHPSCPHTHLLPAIRLPRQNPPEPGKREMLKVKPQTLRRLRNT